MISSVSVVSRHTGQASTPANFLNSAAFPSITGSAAAGRCCRGPARGAVGDHRDGVALDGQPAGVGRVVRDRLAHPGDAGRVGPGQVVPVSQRRLGGDLDLAAEVHQEGPVGDLADLDPVQLVDRLGDVIAWVCRLGVRGHVDHQQAGRRLDDVETGDHSAGPADRRRQFARGTRGRGRRDPHGDRVAGAGNSHRGGLLARCGSCSS